MKIEKALKEVWKWKDDINKETKNMTLHERVLFIRKGANEIRKKYKLNLKQV